MLGVGGVGANKEEGRDQIQQHKQQTRTDDDNSDSGGDYLRDCGSVELAAVPAATAEEEEDMLEEGGLCRSAK